MIDSIVIDSSVWIRVLRKSPDEVLAEEVDFLIRDKRAAFVQVIKIEVLSGATTTKDFESLKQSFEGLVKLEVDEGVWELSAKWAFELRRAGISVPLTDILIAATASMNNALVLHADKHFDFISSKYPVETKNCLQSDAGK